MQNEITIQLFDAKSGKLDEERVVHNLVTDIAKETFYNFGISPIRKLIQFSTKGNHWNKRTADFFQEFFLSDNSDPISASTKMVPGNIVAHCEPTKIYSGTDVRRGTINLNECEIHDDGFTLVYDFATDRAVGSFQTLGFKNKTATWSSDNPLQAMATRYGSDECFGYNADRSEFWARNPTSTDHKMTVYNPTDMSVIAEYPINNDYDTTAIQIFEYKGIMYIATEGSNDYYYAHEIIIEADNTITFSARKFRVYFSNNYPKNLHKTDTAGVWIRGGSTYFSKISEATLDDMIANGDTGNVSTIANYHMGNWFDANVPIINAGHTRTVYTEDIQGDYGYVWVRETDSSDSLNRSERFYIYAINLAKLGVDDANAASIMKAFEKSPQYLAYQYGIDPVNQKIVNFGNATILYAVNGYESSSSPNLTDFSYPMASQYSQQSSYGKVITLEDIATFGPRNLGSAHVLATPVVKTDQQTMKIKYRFKLWA